MREAGLPVISLEESVTIDIEAGGLRAGPGGIDRQAGVAPGVPVTHPRYHQHTPATSDRSRHHLQVGAELGSVEGPGHGEGFVTLRHHTGQLTEGSFVQDFRSKTERQDLWRHYKRQCYISGVKPDRVLEFQFMLQTTSPTNCTRCLV